MSLEKFITKVLNVKADGIQKMTSIEYDGEGIHSQESNIMGPLSRPRSKILRVAVSRIILSSEASKVKLVGNLVA